MSENLAQKGNSSDDKHLIAKAIEYITGYAVDTNTIQHEANNVAFKYKNKDVWSTLSTKLIDDTIRMHEKSLRGRFAKGGEAGFDDSDTTLLLYHEKKGNFMIPKNQIYLWLYEGKGINEKLDSEEYDYVFYPPVSQNMAWRSNFVPPLKQIWTKKFQKINKGSDKLLGVIKAYLLNDGTELYIDMMSTNPAKKKSGIMSYMIQDLRNTFNLTQDQVTFSELTPEGEKFVAKKTYADGGDTEEVYIEFLNKEKGFKKDVKNFNSYEEAVKWARENFEKFNPDMIKYKYADGGGVGKSNDKARYRIRKSNGNIKYAGTDEPSWFFNLEKARELVDYSNGEMIYEYDKNGDELWEVFADGGQVYVHKSNPDITLEFIENTNKGIKGLQKNPKSLSKKERKEGIIVYYSDSEMKQLFNKKYADGGEIKSIKDLNKYLVKKEAGYYYHYIIGNYKFEINEFSNQKGWAVNTYKKHINDDNWDLIDTYGHDGLTLRECKQIVLQEIESSNIQYAKGGDVPHEDKMFQLPLEMVIYVPSTQDVDKVISVDKMDKRVDEVKEYLASKFGGYTSSDKLGGYVDSNGNLVNEDVVQITSFSTKEAFEENKKELIQQIAKWGKDWGQEAIGFEFEGDLMYVPQEL